MYLSQSSYVSVGSSGLAGVCVPSWAATLSPPGQASRAPADFRKKDGAYDGGCGPPGQHQPGIRKPDGRVQG